MDQSQVLTVSQLTTSIKNVLESNFRTCLLQGEITNFKAQSSGHLYFSLKDDFAQISAVMFRGNTLGINPLPKSGDQVIVKGELSLYEPRGTYQIIVRELHYVGTGALLMKLEQMKAKLQARGWFDSARKKLLPKFPKRIGVVTSPTGAVIQDILNVLTRRHAGFQLVLNPVKVQGEGAAQEIAQAIYQMNEHHLCDVLIVGRGGGSIEDLWAFNEEIVAKAIFDSKIPVISAVGHESDTALSDFVADVRAPTPSAAAEIVIAEKGAQIEFLIKSKRSLSQALYHIVRKDRERFQGIIRHPVFTSTFPLLGRSSLKLDELQRNMESCLDKKLNQLKSLLIEKRHKLSSLRPEEKIARTKQRIQFLNKQVDQVLQHALHMRSERLKAVTSKLVALDPKNLLRKGYSILFSEKDASLIISSKQIKNNDRLRAVLADGEISLTVTPSIIKDTL